MKPYWRTHCSTGHIQARFTWDEELGLLRELCSSRHAAALDNRCKRIAYAAREQYGGDVQVGGWLRVVDGCGEG